MTSSIEGLLKALSTLANTHSESQLQLANIASYTSLIFENTQHSEKETSFIPKALGSLGGPHARLGEETEKHGLSLELFLRLMIGCQVKSIPFPCYNNLSGISHSHEKDEV